jgi:hypothetical protein
MIARTRPRAQPGLAYDLGLMELAAFVESHVKGLRREPAASPPRPVSCLAVKKIAKRCVATRAGVEAGDLLSLVDGSPASRRSPKLYEDRAATRLLTFYSRCSSRAWASGRAAGTRPGSSA